MRIRIKIRRVSFYEYNKNFLSFLKMQLLIRLVTPITKFFIKFKNRVEFDNKLIEDIFYINQFKTTI